MGAVIVKEALSKLTVSWFSGLGVTQEKAGPGFDSVSAEAPAGEGSKAPCVTAVPALQFDVYVVCPVTKGPRMKTRDGSEIFWLKPTPKSWRTLGRWCCCLRSWKRPRSWRRKCTSSSTIWSEVDVKCVTIFFVFHFQARLQSVFDVIRSNREVSSDFPQHHRHVLVGACLLPTSFSHVFLEGIRLRSFFSCSHRVKMGEKRPLLPYWRQRQPSATGEVGR